MEIYYSVTVASTDEILMALLTQFDFESFEEYDDHFIAYIQKSNMDEDIRAAVETTIKRFTDQYSISEIAPQNWNAIWEASFQPVIVDDFCQIRADFHPPIDNIQHDVVINPKMAFGTGHHATTHMMISQMANIDFQNKIVFDFGCGTGILAILASKLGAKEIDALDIERESYLNTIENSEINQVKNVFAFEGDLDIAPEKLYDIILANINRNILVRYAHPLVHKLNNGGDLLLSGVLEEDKDIVIQTFEKEGLTLLDWKSMDGWICAHLKK